jgi:hypothetical protein
LPRSSRKTMSFEEPQQNQSPEQEIKKHAKHVFEDFMQRAADKQPYLALAHLASQRLTQMEYPEDEVALLAAQIALHIMEEHKAEVEEVNARALPPYSIRR